MRRLRLGAGGEIDELAARGFPARIGARPRGLLAGVAEGARDEIGGELVGRRLVAGGGELEELVVLVAAAERGETQGGLAAREGEHAVEVAVVFAVVEADRIAQVE